MHIGPFVEATFRAAWLAWLLGTDKGGLEHADKLFKLIDLSSIRIKRERANKIFSKVSKLF